MGSEGTEGTEGEKAELKELLNFNIFLQGSKHHPILKYKIFYKIFSNTTNSPIPHLERLRDDPAPRVPKLVHLHLELLELGRSWAGHQQGQAIRPLAAERVVGEVQDVQGGAAEAEGVAEGTAIVYRYAYGQYMCNA